MIADDDNKTLRRYGLMVAGILDVAGLPTHEAEPIHDRIMEGLCDAHEVGAPASFLKILEALLAATPEKLEEIIPEKP